MSRLHRERIEMREREEKRERESGKERERDLYNMALLLDESRER